jgi:hypothetical protein
VSKKAAKKFQKILGDAALVGMIEPEQIVHVSRFSQAFFFKIHRAKPRGCESPPDFAPVIPRSLYSDSGIIHTGLL